MSSVSVRRVSLRFPLYGVDARSLKKHLAKVTVGGRLGRGRSGPSHITALEEVSFELRSGERLGLVGHNGSGKTTLLRTLAGAYEPDEGEVEIHGRRASLLDLSLGIDPTATGFDNIFLRGRLAGLSNQEIERRLDDIVAFSGLGPFLAMPLKTYSAGMQARLAFAVTTAVDAEILLMDEWLAVGDAEFQAAAQERLSRLIEQSSILVLASHDLNLLAAHCNCAIVMDAGRASPKMPISELAQYLQGHTSTPH